MSKLIMLVDAEAALRGEIAEALAAQGYAVQENADGRDVVEQVRAARPSALVLCVELPRGSGYAICSKLKKDEGLKNIPVVLTSAEATPKAFEDHRKLKFGHAEEYLLKPVAAATVVERVMGLLGDTPHQASALDDEPLGLDDDLAGGSSGGLDRHLDDSFSATGGDGLGDLADEFGDHPGEEAISVEEIEEIAVEDDLAPNASSLPGEADVDLLESAFERLEEPAPNRRNQLNGSGKHLAPSPGEGEVGDSETDSLFEHLERDEDPAAELAGGREAPLLELGGLDPEELSAGFQSAGGRESRFEGSREPLAARAAPGARPAAEAAVAGRSPIAANPSRGSPTSRPPAASSAAGTSLEDPAPPPAPRPATLGVGGGRDRDYFQLKERLEKREKELVRLREELTEKEKELLEQRERETAIERELAAKDEELSQRETHGRQLQQKIDSLVAGQRKADKDLTSAREEARSATQRAAAAEAAQTSAEAEASAQQASLATESQRLEDARQRLAAAEAEADRQRGRADEHEAELAGVRAQLDEANATADDLRQRLDRQHQEGEAAQEDLRQRLEESERDRQRHQDRVVKAYQRLKDGEKVREKARKALGIAQQLLEESVELTAEDGEEQRP